MLQVGDIRDRGALDRALSDADLVVHCAGAVGVAQSVYRVHHYVDVNVGGTALLLELLTERKRPLRKLVIFASMTCYGEGLYRRPSDGTLLRVGIRTESEVQRYGWEPVCPQKHETLEPVPTPEDLTPQAHNIYALTKRYQEELALGLGEVYGFPVVCLRLFNVYGPRQSLSNPYTGVLAIFLSRLLAGQPPVVYEDGNQTRDFVSVHDVVNAALLAIERPEANGQVINIGSGMPRWIGGCARTLAHLLGRGEIQPQISGQFRKGDIRHCTADTSKARRLLGYEPQVRWEDGLAELIEWASTTPSVDRFDQAERELRQRGLVR
jgi:dTDP-L-rhamnose 4-epimerase